MAQTTLRDYLRETEDAISAGRIDEALNGCRRILRQYPESLEVQRLLGEVYLAQGQLDEAQQAFDWVLTNDPENVIAYCDRALISERRSDFDTALDCYQQAYELSRGNSQIRREFNKLSERAGQQGFMFSRAGLARLYMRGDLLVQAVQEWEAVLSGSPERLDARIGLLETYWREGHSDQVERLATQILEEVPSCLKALLLLAYAVAAKDVPRAQELLQRAEALDPDLVMAQDLFADMMASRPDDPFLTLLRKSPVGLEISQKMAATLPETDADKTQTFSASALNASTSAHAFANWSSMDAWSSADGAGAAQKDAQPAQDSADLPVWTSDDFPQIDAWRALEKSQATAPGTQFSDIAEQLTSDMKKIDMPGGPGQSGEPAQQEEPRIEAWRALQASAASEAIQQLPDQQEQPWDNLLPGAGFEDANAWEGLGDFDATGAASSWDAPAEADEAPAPPAWLSMLTQGERKQLAAQQPGAPSSLAPEVPEEPALQQAAAFDLPPAWKDERVADVQPEEQPEAAEDEERLSFGPEWLKSLGAAPIEEDTHTAEQVLPSAAEAQPQRPEADYEAWSTPAAGHAEAKEQDALVTLEALEQDLYAQGFMPLEPHSLSTVARSQVDEPAMLEEPQMQEVAEEPSLKQALAEFASFEQPSTTSINAPPAPAPEPQQPTWMAALQPSFTPRERQPSQRETVAGPVFEPQAPEVKIDPPEELTDIEATVSAAIRRQPSLAGSWRETGAALPGQMDALLDGELETTMRRPAVRLQPVQRQAAMPPGHRLPSNRGRASERLRSKALDGNLSYQQRLVRGYQYQLVGDYDEAMQEYHIIIRNAPELLGEVVSNVRALLKLAPKYTAGYRVLGDAYMRQGEYLQAMEAYNKALTMARKARA